MNNRVRSKAASLGLAAMLAAAGYGSAALAQVSPGGHPNYGTVSLLPGFNPDPHQVSVVSGGSVPASTVSERCRGYITASPDVVLNLGGNSPWLRIYATSGSDTTLVVRRPGGGILCADDSFGQNPSVEGPFRAGRYAVWLGAYRAGENARATISFTEERSNHP